MITSRESAFGGDAEETDFAIRKNGSRAPEAVGLRRTRGGPCARRRVRGPVTAPPRVRGSFLEHAWPWAPTLRSPTPAPPWARPRPGEPAGDKAPPRGAARCLGRNPKSRAGYLRLRPVGAGP